MIYHNMLSACFPSLVLVGEYIVKEGWDTGPRLFDDYTLIYYPLGSNTRYIQGESTIVLDKPCIVLTPPHIPHRYIFDSHQPVRHIFAYFH